MAAEVSVRGGWHVKEVRGREGGQYALPTMADAGGTDLRRFFRTIYRGKWILILTIAVTIGATLYWTRQATPLYSAAVLIVIEPRASSILPVDEAVPDVYGDAAQVNTALAALQSRDLAARVIRDLGLDKDPEFTRKDRPDDDLGTETTNGEATSDRLLAYVNAKALLSALDSVKSLRAHRPAMTSVRRGAPRQWRVRSRMGPICSERPRGAKPLPCFVGS